jgi:hypothetical protein
MFVMLVGMARVSMLIVVSNDLVAVSDRGLVRVPHCLDGFVACDCQEFFDGYDDVAFATDLAHHE